GGGWRGWRGWRGGRFGGCRAEAPADPPFPTVVTCRLRRAERWLPAQPRNPVPLHPSFAPIPGARPHGGGGVAAAKPRINGPRASHWKANALADPVAGQRGRRRDRIVL